MGKVRFGIIGGGSIGRVHGEIISKLKNAELVAVSSRTEKSCKDFSKAYNCKDYLNYEDLLKDPDVDAVAICLPSGSHSQAAIKAAQHKKHIICEKPMDTEIPRAEDMIRIAEENDAKLAIIFQHRFDRPIEVLKRAIDEGLLGKLLWGSAKTIWYRDEEYYSNPWRGTWEFDGGGALINQSIHYIDLLLHIFGDPKSVVGTCRTLLHQGIETEDVGLATIEFENGALGTIEGSTVSYPGLYAEISVFGEKGSVIIRNDELFSYHFKDGKNEDFERIVNPQAGLKLNTSVAVNPSSHIKQYEDFVDSILNDREPIINGEEGIKSLRLIKAIYESSQEDKKIYF